jgi:hypothetical protein
MLSTSIHRLHDLFQLIRFSAVFDIRADKASAIPFWCALVCRNEKGAALKNLAGALHTDPAWVYVIGHLVKSKL